MLRGLVFWAGAIIASAAVAYLVVVPPGGDTEPPQVDPVSVADFADDSASSPAPDDNPPAAEEGNREAEIATDVEAPEEEAEDADDAAELNLGVLPVDELPFDAECGMHLRPAGQREAIFATGISLDPQAAVPAALLVNGELVILHRADAAGEPIGYSQFPRQVFRSDDDTMTVEVEVEVEENLLSDWAQVVDSSMTITQQDATTRLAVGGRVGC